MKKKISINQVYRRSVRYRISNALLILAFIAALILLVIKADEVLIEYQASVPEEYAAEVWEKWKNGQLDEWYESAKDNLTVNETKEMYLVHAASFMGDMDFADLKMHKLSQNKYVFTFDKSGKRLSFQLYKSGETRHHFPVWTVCDLENNLLQEKTYSLKAPSSSVVTVNNEPINPAYISQDNLPCGIGYGLYKDVEAMAETLYEIPWNLSLPDVQVTDRRGREQTIIEVGDDLHAAQYNYDDDILNQYTDKCLHILKLFCSYTVGLTNVYDVYNVTLPSTRAYESVQEYAKWSSQKAGDGRFEDLCCAHFVDIGNGDFSCELTGRYICSYQTRDDTTYELSYTMVFTIAESNVLLKDFIITPNL